MSISLALYEKAIPAGKSFEEMFEITKACGFDRFEISIDETDARLKRLEMSAAEQSELGTLARRSGTPIRTMCLSGHRKYPLGASDPQVRERSMDIMKKAVDFSVNAGISIIQLAGYDVYYEESTPDTVKWFTENLIRSTEYAASRGVVLAFESMETPFMDTIEKIMKYVELVDSPWLGIYPDIGNLKNAAVLYGHDVTEDLLKGRGHTFAVHLKETNPGIYRDMNYGTGGHTEYVPCIRAALDMGVRMFTGEFWYQKGQDYMKVITESNEFLRNVIREAENA
ncbi:MAG: L-ribulose-5-phosphate 3-epimerase [Erysipelotrichaceae bacterium]|nr:L-ribulose-5-phosphate 3-epimerase [Erysipelotrichaceae bacterium]